MKHQSAVQTERDQQAREQRIAPRRTLFPTASQIAQRDHNARLMRQQQPHPLDALDTTNRDTRYGLAETGVYTEDEKARALRITATLDDNGIPLMPESFFTSLEGSPVMHKQRKWLEPDEVAAVLECGRQLVYDAVAKGELRGKRPGDKERGRIRIYVDALISYITERGYSPEEITAMTTHIQQIVTTETTAQV